MNIVMKSWHAVLLAIVIGIAQFVSYKWIGAKIENAVKLNYDIELKARERAERVAEYMALARDLKEGSSEEDYRKANRLSWELAMWLPADVYKTMGKALAAPDEGINPLFVVIRVRKVLLGNTFGELTQDDIIHHAPGIGRKQKREPNQ